MTLLKRLAVRVGFVGAFAASTIPGMAAQRGSGKVDVTGEWVLEVTLPDSTATPRLTIKQEGDKLTGHYSGKTIGETDLVGMVRGETIAFEVEASFPNGKVTLVYTGKLTSDKAIKGDLKISNGTTGTFTGKRQ